MLKTFEINAETLIKLANNNTLTLLQIPCMRCEKCETCIETENKKKNDDKNKFAEITIENSENYFLDTER